MGLSLQHVLQTVVHSLQIKLLQSVLAVSRASLCPAVYGNISQA
jgi:hypothetical protein